MEKQYEEEINLMDYIKIIIKRKKLILGISLIAILLASLFSFLSAKTYKIDTVIEIGQVAGKQIEVADLIIGKIESDVYGVVARERLSLSEKDYLEIRAERLKETRLIRVSIESANTQEASDILNEINNLILEKHQMKYDERFSLAKKYITGIEDELKYLKNYKAYADLGIAQLNEQLFDKRERLDNSRMTAVVKKPTVADEPIKPKPLINIALAGFLGFFLSLFIIFFKEWWENNKKEVLDKKF